MFIFSPECVKQQETVRGTKLFSVSNDMIKPVLFTMKNRNLSILIKMHFLATPYTLITNFLLNVKSFFVFKL